MSSIAGVCFSQVTRRLVVVDAYRWSQKRYLDFKLILALLATHSVAASQTRFVSEDRSLPDLGTSSVDSMWSTGIARAG